MSLFNLVGKRCWLPVMQVETSRVDGLLQLYQLRVSALQVALGFSLNLGWTWTSLGLCSDSIQTLLGLLVFHSDLAWTLLGLLGLYSDYSDSTRTTRTLLGLLVVNSEFTRSGGGSVKCWRSARSSE